MKNGNLWYNRIIFNAVVLLKILSSYGGTMKLDISLKRTGTIIKRFGTSNTQIEEVTVGDNPNHYVLKRIRYVDTALQHAMFQKECSALEKLKSCDYVVHIMDATRGTRKNGIAEGWIVMEYLTGMTLSRSIQELSYSIGDKFRIISQLIVALEVIHGSGIIHRDISPNNIMIDNGKIKIIDFGICKILGDIGVSETTYQFATDRYAAPEVKYHSENASVQSDIYSLGAVIYYLFTKKEPPLPDEFEEAIRIAGGIDIELKPILVKMTAKNPADRYADVFTISNEMASLFQRFLKTDEIYRVYIADSNIYHLKNCGLLMSSRTNQQILTCDLPKEFSPSYGFIRQKADAKEAFVFYGRHILLECTYDSDRDCFITTSANNLPEYIRCDNIDKCHEISGSFEFSTNLSFTAMRNDSFTIANRIRDHVVRTHSSSNINDSFQAKYGIWRDYLDCVIESVREEAVRFHYNKYYTDGDLIVFTLTPNQRFAIEAVGIGQTMIYEAKDEKTERSFPLGELVRFIPEHSQVVLKRIGKHTKRMPPQNGTIALDYLAKIAQYVNQRDALVKFVREETANSSNLKAVFTGIDSPTEFSGINPAQFYDKRLDESQQEAVRKALSARDLFLVQGPPGTGKSSVIVEIVRQMLLANAIVTSRYQRILVVSQAHVAVNKLLSDLDEHIPELSAVRVGKPNDLSQLARDKYSLDTQKSNWISASISKSKAKLQDELKRLSISEDDYRSAFAAFECCKLESSRPQDIEAAQLVIDEFCAAHMLTRTSTDVQRLILLQEWLNQTAEKDDLVEYFVKDASVIIGTCSGFMGSRMKSYFDDVTFSCVIVDEAAKATIPELLLSIIKAQKVILVGDHFQLPPVFDEKALQKTSKVSTKELKKRGFGQLYEILKRNGYKHAIQFLSTQYRMHPSIGSMVSHVFYEDDILNGVPAEERTLPLCSFAESAIVWASTSQMPAEKRYETPHYLFTQGEQRLSYQNHLEADYVIKYLQLIDGEIPSSDFSIGIITAYMAQAILLRQLVPTVLLKNLEIDIEQDINTVDAFQGSQRDIIIYSTVRSSAEGRIGFLSEKPRLNVAFSRAKRLLLIIGDLDCLESAKAEEFSEVAEYIRSNGQSCRIIDIAGEKS